MSGKIELTQKQFDVVHRFINNNGLQEFAQFRDTLPTEYKVISSLTVDEVAKILYKQGSYVIGSKYKYGD